MNSWMRLPLSAKTLQESFQAIKIVTTRLFIFDRAKNFFSELKPYCAGIIWRQIFSIRYVRSGRYAIIKLDHVQEIDML